MTTRSRLLAAASLLAAACADPRPLAGLAVSNQCDPCHGAPPATGAHLLHATPASTAALAYGAVHVLEDVAPGAATTTRYDFGCGSCHPLDPARHGAARAQVDLDPAGAPPGSLRARNLAGARYDPVTRTCSGVACHASGQDAVALGALDPVALASTYRTTPRWDAPAGALGCEGCHGNPPRYPSGGAGAPDANSHLVLATGAWESGHLLGLPGAFHGSKHGGITAGEGAAPITCQTCHADTVDPSATGPSGFYWLDTTGSYQLPGGDPSRLALAEYAALRCTTCHDGVRAAAGAGRVLPLRHVNGRRDVVFDRRLAVPPLPGAPSGTSAPTRPYWVSDGSPGGALPLDATYDGTTLSLHLGSAAYDPATKSCTSVACHLSETTVRWGTPHGTCTRCHSFPR